MFIFTLIYAFLLYNKVLEPDEITIYIATYILGGVLFFVLGLLKGIFIKKNGLLEGLLSGTFIIFIVLLTNFIIGKNFTSMNLVKIIAYISLSSLGGIIGVNISK